jgi:hypothetical protein
MDTFKFIWVLFRVIHTAFLQIFNKIKQTFFVPPRYLQKNDVPFKK